MSKSVFISYRRDDAKWQARELYRSLTQALRPENVFMDVDSIPPGVDFRDHLRGWVHRCDCLLALIGQSWAQARDPQSGSLRLVSSTDFVRFELRCALERKIPVVPVLIDGATLPQHSELPEDIADIVYRQAVTIDVRTASNDIETLIRKLGLKSESHERLGKFALKNWPDGSVI